MAELNRENDVVDLSFRIVYAIRAPLRFECSLTGPFIVLLAERHRSNRRRTQARRSNATLPPCSEWPAYLPAC